MPRRLVAQQWISLDGFASELDVLVAPVLLGAGTPLVAPDGPYRLSQLGGDVWPSSTRVRYAVTYDGRPGRDDSGGRAGSPPA